MFDKDGTLLDFQALYGTWAAVMTKQLERIEPRVDWAAALGVRFLEEPLPVHDPAGPLAMASNSQLEAILAWQLYQSGWAWNEAVQQVQEQFEKVNQTINTLRPVKPTAGVEAFLKACRTAGLPLAVVTADDTLMAERHLEWSGLRPYFQAVIGTDQVARGKPNPDMALLACQRLAVKPNRALVIGDTSGDIMMGRQAGLRAAILVGGRKNGSQQAAAQTQPEAADRREAGMHCTDSLPPNQGIAALPLQPASPRPARAAIPDAWIMDFTELTVRSTRPEGDEE
nr:HAD family hydrolase [Paenibacillus turpanensis]